MDRAPEPRRPCPASAAWALSLLACACTTAAPRVAQAPAPSTVLIEAEAFADHGGWVLDAQFMDLMGSPFLLAHGMGRPVEDARTTVTLPSGGPWHLWVRTRDWVAPWNAPGAPGRFEVRIDGAPVGVFGDEGEPWHWQNGGRVEVERGAHELVLHDLTGFEGRCDAIVLSADPDFRPPEDALALANWRRRAAGHPAEPLDAGTFDLVVVGGGVAGTSAAVTAARQGLSVALIQDRPVLGGNASSEVRVWPEGHVNQEPWPRVGDVVMELVPERRADSSNGQGAHVFDDERKLRVARAEPNLHLFLEQRVGAADADGARILAVTAEDVRTGTRRRFAGRLFADCTGDGALGALVGAEFEQTDAGHMGASNLWNVQCLCEDEEALGSELERTLADAAFPRCPWAVDLSDAPFPGRDWGSLEPEAGDRPVVIGNWYWESGFDLDPIADMERIRDQNLRAMYGAWDAIKNVEGRYPAHRLGWVAYVAGKRESRRLLGPVVLTADDLRDGTVWPDGCFPCTWGIDTHHPDARYAEGHGEDAFVSDYTRGAGYEYEGPYWAPYRTLFSRNVSNLFMAGRDISVTHEALGAVRVMKTTGAMGEIVGFAAAVCASNDCAPADVFPEHWDAMESHMRVGAGRQTPVRLAGEGPFRLEASEAAARGRTVRYEPARDCLGYWRSADDHATWPIELEGGGRFAVALEYSSAAGEDGGHYEIHVDGRRVTEDDVVASGAWERFVLGRRGHVDLGPGRHRVTVRGARPNGPLFKLRAVVLEPDVGH